MEISKEKKPQETESFGGRIGDTLIVFRRSLIYQVKEFFQNSTLHGVRYIAEMGRPAGEKFMWFCFTSMATVTALIIIMSLWEKFQTNPTITGLDTDFVVQSVVFPTTVLCPFEPYDDNKAYDMAFNTFSNYDEGTANETAKFLKILTVLNFTNLMEAYELGKNIAETQLKQLNLRSWPFKILPECSDMFESCKYRDLAFDCCDHMQLVYTDNGMCYAFNSRYMSTDKADLESAQSNILYETDKKWSLFIKPTRYSKVFIIADDEYFGSVRNEGLTWQGDTVELRLSKKTTYTTDDTRQLSIGQRKCIFFDEMPQKYFPGDYTYSSCMDECYINKALQFCNCNPPFFRPIDGKMCDLEDFPCLHKHRENITDVEGCPKCELSCTNSVFTIQRLVISSEEQGNEHGLVVEFITWPIIRFKREVLFGWVDLLVSFGGIASLFLGFSLLSGVEIVYYFTLRACCMVYMNRQELREMEQSIRNRPPPPIDLTLRISSNPTLSRNESDQSAEATNSSRSLPDDMRKRRKTEKDYAAYSRNLFKKNTNIVPYGPLNVQQYLP